MRGALYIIICIFTLFTLNSAFCATSNTNSTNPNSTLGQVVFVPKGIILKGVLATPINTKVLHLGDSVQVLLDCDFNYGNTTIAYKGSMLTGKVVLLKKASSIRHYEQIGVRFNSLINPQGFEVPVSAVFNTQDKKGILKGKEINISSNTKIEVYFDQPITTAPPNSVYGY